MNKNRRKIQIIGGPCSAESKTQVLDLAQIAATADWSRFRAGLWKPRTRPGYFEGVGEKGLSWLATAQREFGVKALTEVATPAQAEHVVEAGLHGFWIGARTTVNPFYVREIARAVEGADIEVWIKNPIHPEIKSWIGAIERFKLIGLNNIGAIHRGFYFFRSSELRNSPVWSIPLGLRKELPDIPVFCDISHIAGNTNRIPIILNQAMGLNFTGVMAEIHRQPGHALTDRSQQVTPEEFKNLMNDQLQKNENDIGENRNATLQFETENWQKVIDEEILRLGKIRDSLPNQMYELNAFLDIINRENSL
ncbi:MAG: phospho-2-dehydro-3-deoxyheptonate aldolase [Bacteroidetes bacterium]|jgi:chorismate mutase|nr:phospho-2-dehydro-3-deoxyheptonate aldolase [Bacteroidota bacterium]